MSKITGQFKKKYIIDLCITFRYTFTILPFATFFPPRIFYILPLVRFSIAIVLMSRSTPDNGSRATLQVWMLMAVHRNLGKVVTIMSW